MNNSSSLIGGDVSSQANVLASPSAPHLGLNHQGMIVPTMTMNAPYGAGFTPGPAMGGSPFFGGVIAGNPAGMGQYRPMMMPSANFMQPGPYVATHQQMPMMRPSMAPSVRAPPMSPQATAQLAELARRSDAILAAEMERTRMEG